MRRFKVPLTALSLVLVLADAVMGFRLWASGWPKRVGLTSDQRGIEHVQVVPIPFTGLDWLILVLVIGFHVLLLYLLWKAWRPSPVTRAA